MIAPRQDIDKTFEMAITSRTIEPLERSYVSANCTITGLDDDL